MRSLRWTIQQGSAEISTFRWFGPVRDGSPMEGRAMRVRAGLGMDYHALMPKADQNLQRVLDRTIVAVIRSESPDLLVDVAEALLAGGVEVMEVTFTVPRAARVIEKVADKLGSRILLGAGTVLDPETARAAILAGAEFIVSPAVNVEVIQMCRRYSKLCMPGAFTPNEGVTAWGARAEEH